MAAIDMTNSLRQGIYRDLAETWRQEWPIYEAQNKLLGHYLPHKTARVAEYGWKQAVPSPVRWDRERGRTHQMLDDVKITVNYVPYEITIDVESYDAQDDQLMDAKQHVNQSVTKFLLLTQKLIAEYLNGVAVLNDDLELAYDGAAAFSKTEGDGSNRLGIVDGNLLTGTGTKIDDISNDLYRCQEQALKFVDTSVTGDLLYDASDVMWNKCHVIAPPGLNRVFNRIEKAATLRTDALSNTAEGNIFMNQLAKVHYNSYLTDNNDWFFVIEHKFWKPFLIRAQNDIRTIWADLNNSDRARQTNLETLYADLRTGTGFWHPATIIKVSNT